MKIGANTENFINALMNQDNSKAFLTTACVHQCVKAYSSGNIIVRIINAIKSIFGRSDWQKACTAWVNHILTNNLTASLRSISLIKKINELIQSTLNSLVEMNAIETPNYGVRTTQEHEGLRNVCTAEWNKAREILFPASSKKPIHTLLQERDAFVKLFSENPKFAKIRARFSKHLFRSASDPADDKTLRWFSKREQLEFLKKEAEALWKTNSSPAALSVMQRAENKLALLQKGKPVMLGQYYHATKLERVVPILKSGEIQVRHEKMARGAFVSTLPENDAYGEYVFALDGKGIERRSSTVCHGFGTITGDAETKRIWAGFSKPIPIGKLTYIVVTQEQPLNTRFAAWQQLAQGQNSASNPPPQVPLQVKIDTLRDKLKQEGFGHVEVVSEEEADLERILLAKLRGPNVVPKEWIGSHHYESRRYRVWRPGFFGTS